MSDDAQALQARLDESEARRAKTEQQAKNYVAKLMNQHKEEKEKLQRELDESKELLRRAKEGVPNGHAPPAADDERAAEAQTQIAALQAEKQQIQQQAKEYVGKLVNKHNAELERCKAEHVQKLQEAQARLNGTADSVDGDTAHVNASEEQRKSLQAELEAAVERLKESENERQKLQELLEQTKEQAKNYVKQLVAKHKSEVEESVVKATELQEEVDNLRANAEAHDLAMNARDEMVQHAKAQLQDAHARLAESEDHLAAALTAAEGGAPDSGEELRQESEALKHQVQTLQEQALPSLLRPSLLALAHPSPLARSLHSWPLCDPA